MERQQTDIILIGAGIMSATLGVLLKQLEPGYRIQVFERLGEAATESSDAWNNAGTGHSAFCELNYTPEREDGSIDTTKAVKIAESFEVSKQFWSYLVEHQIIKVPDNVIHPIPHMSFVWGEKNVDYLRRRYNALQECHLFRGMEFSTDPARIAAWAPLVMQGREAGEAVAATKMDLGTDVNFGALTRCLVECLRRDAQVGIHFDHEVVDIEREGDQWRVRVKDLASGERRDVLAPFVFIGAGGGSLPLLLKSGIPEGKGFGGFPVSGQWLRCTNENVIARHEAKVYGTAAVGSPPMSVPHLDTRWINGKRELLFGPYAGFTTRFLKHGSVLDLFKSIKFSNLRPMVAAGIHNMPLTKYLIDQVRLTPEARLGSLKEYYPGARMEDWELAIAGYRVQVIKKDEEEGGILEFGTEVVSAADGSIAALLGASPGASTAVSIMLSLLERCFPQKVNTPQWQGRIRELVPSYGRSMGKDAALLQEMRSYTSRVLQLPLPAAAS
ncbi:malate:quinone oxidoreductase [Flaviaesturariibacter flavus]|uniref:Probable malate:quinone oxidoreductase n=1 Tax=Flaviaesturariibacter flavus TaxID=2502780 RepID=A0A4R1B8C1_9BACT|nr:malate:quinone oxidoreductase [Flaviaesturariibacter flavus]TCJ13158.1 malate:quinone oxidoreductase [Flaviaesturariibacter flavus]